MVSGRIVLVGVSRTLDGLTWEAKDILRIGTKPSLEVVVDDPSVSLQHCELRVSPNGWGVHNLGTASRTLVNGMPVKITGRKIHEQDSLQCGNLVFKVDKLDIDVSSQVPAFETSNDIKTTGPLLRVRASSQRSWEQGLRDMAGDDGPAHAKHFLAMLRAGYHLSHIDSLAELLQSFLDDTVAVLNGRHGAILLMDEGKGDLTLRSWSPKIVPGQGFFSRTLATRCFGKGESLLCLDPHKEEGGGSPDSHRGSMGSVICTLLRSPRRRLGVLYLDRDAGQAPFTADDFKLADAIAATVSLGIESAIDVAEQKNRFQREAVKLARQAIESRDPEISRHSKRVANYALFLADELALSPAERSLLEIGSWLHDIGKIGVEDAVLRKKGALSPDEVASLRTHPLKGVALVESISELAPMTSIVRSHHEHWDGSGYPDGLKGQEIPHLARLVALADTLDHLTARSFNNPNTSLDRVFGEIVDQTGRQLDPDAVAALFRARSKVEESWARIWRGEKS